MIRIYFPAPSTGYDPVGTGTGSAGSAGYRAPSNVAAIPTIPESVLVRHGARILRPMEAAVRGGGARPRPTVYRQDVLLVPNDELTRISAGWQRGFVKADEPVLVPTLNDILTHLDLQLLQPPPVKNLPGSPDDPADRPRVHLPVAIDVSRGARPIDAWTVLQAILAAVPPPPPGASEDERDLRRVVELIALDHLMIGSALDGAGSGMIEGTNTASHGSPDLGTLFDRPTWGTSGRVPVTVAMSPPERPRPVGRRPVVAVLDTGIAAHPWLPTAEVDDPLAAEAVVLVDSPLQTMIEEAGRLGGSGSVRAPIVGYEDRPAIEEPLLGELSTHTGHGTFIAGIIRQLAPAAQVYAVRVMHPDGFAHEADLVLALKSIASRVHAGTLTVDVVSLSLGYFHEGDEEGAVTAAIEPVLRDLARAGVTVVAAAGNFSTSRPFYPAALASPAGPNAAPLISVGALNPNSTTARFSNEAPWVNCYASGVAIVSTFPLVRGAHSPGARAGRRESFDADDFCSGFALWSGTSFAAPALAACLAARLPGHVPGGLSDTKPAGARAALEALAELRADQQLTIRADGDRPA